MKSINLSKEKLNKLNAKIPNLKNKKGDWLKIYPRTYKGILFYELSYKGIPCARYFYVKNKWRVLTSMSAFMGNIRPLNEKFRCSESVKFSNKYTWNYQNIFGMYDVPESKSIISKQDLRNYLDIKIIDIIRHDNLELLETACKEGWIEIFKSRRFNPKGKTIQEQWGLPNFSRKQIHKLKTFLNGSADEYAKYLDYIDTARKARRKFNESSYFIKTWKEAHRRDIAKLNKEKEEQRRLAMLRKKKIKRKLYSIDLKDIVKLEDPKTKDDLKVLGKELRNCVSTYDPKKVKVFLIKSLNEKIAVEWWDKEVHQARVVDNLDVPKKIKQYIAKELRKGKKQNAKI